MEPVAKGFIVCRKSPPIPTTSARETTGRPPDFQTTLIPLGALWRAYLRCFWNVVAIVGLQPP